MRLVFFGDSLIESSYGGSLMTELSALLPQHTVINAGRSGDTVLNLLQRLDEALAYKPNGVFVMIGGNDAISYSQPATRGYYRKSKGVPDGIVTPEMFARAYRDLLTQLQLAHVGVWVGLPPVEYNPTLVDALRQFNALAADIARSHNIPTLDLLTALLPAAIPARPPLSLKMITVVGEHIENGWRDYESARQHGGYTYSFDGVHLMPEAAKRIAGMIAQFLGV